MELLAARESTRVDSMDLTVAERLYAQAEA